MSGRGRIVLPGEGPGGQDEPGAQRVYTIEAGSGVDQVLLERVRQVCAEGFDGKHDARWTSDELIGAAIALLLSAMSGGHDVDDATAEGLIEMARDFWPSGAGELKRKTPDRDLVRAAALLLAELDRRYLARSAERPVLQS
ncbi:MAG TPA: hypothetical protein VGF89_01070 [Steroidobacteraceae bacterium]